jgi:glycosyltransferase involved in cell wall biosynthesis
VDAVAAARKRGLAATLDIFGDGPARGALAGQVARLGLADVVRFRGIASHEELRILLPAYDAGFVTTRQDVMTRFSLSTKLLEYIHLGIPVVLPRIPAYLAYFPEDCGWYFAPGSVPDAVRALEALAESGGERNARALRARHAYAGRIDPAAEAEALSAIYGELLGADPAAASRIRKVASATERS